MEPSINPVCRNCQKPIHGRSDKKYCDEYCRNNYNNQFKSQKSNYVRKINNRLLRNRSILEDLLRNQCRRVNRQQLEQEGFWFSYHTDTYITKNGRTYYYCYEFGYLPIESDWFIIVKRSVE